MRPSHVLRSSTVVLLGVSSHIARKTGPRHTLGLRMLNSEVSHSGRVGSEEATMDPYGHVRDRSVKMFRDKSGKVSQRLPTEVVAKTASESFILRERAFDMK